MKTLRRRLLAYSVLLMFWHWALGAPYMAKVICAGVVIGLLTAFALTFIRPASAR